MSIQIGWKTILIVFVSCIFVWIPKGLVPHRLHEVSDTILFFDGHCNLCNGFVNFVVDQDPSERIRFGAIQRHTDMLRGLDAPTDLSTMILVQNNQVYTHSSAALRTFALLRAPFHLIAALYILPRPIRDIGYRLVAKYRYAVFGKTETCRAPTGDFERRFIDYEGDPPEKSLPFAP